MQDGVTIYILSAEPPKSYFMKKRISRVLNFFAFNLLFFALYLNFIHKDNVSAAVPAPQSTSTTVKGTVLVEHPEQYIMKAENKEASTAQLSN